MCPKTQTLLNDFSAKLRLQRYAASSIKTYTNALAKFLWAFSDKNLAHLTLEDFSSFLIKLQSEQQISSAYQRQIIASIDKFYQLFSRQLTLLSVALTILQRNQRLRLLTSFEARSTKKVISVLKIKK